MIDAREAVDKARVYFESVYQGSGLKEVLLEEIELIEEGKYWLVTFGFDWIPASGTSSIGPGERKHKAVTLDAGTGQLISMKIIKIDAY